MDDGRGMVMLSQGQRANSWSWKSGIGTTGGMKLAEIRKMQTPDSTPSLLSERDHRAILQYATDTPNTPTARNCMRTFTS